MTALAVKINTGHFTGSSKLFSREADALGSVMRDMLQYQAKMAAAQISPLTDNSAGTNQVGGLTVINPVTPGSDAGNTGAAKTDVDIAMGEVNQDITVLVAQVNLLQAVVPAVPALTNNVGGTVATPGTLAAVLKVFTGTATSPASAANFNAWLAAVAVDLDLLAVYVNELCVATNTPTLAGSTLTAAQVQTLRNYGNATFAALAANSGTADSGTACVKATDAAATFTLLANIIATFAAKLNAIVAHAAGYLVVRAVAA